AERKQTSPLGLPSLPDELPSGFRREGRAIARQPATERTISAMRLSVCASTVSKYHAAGIRSPSTPPAGWKSAFSVIARFRRSEEHTSELQSRFDLVCRLLL